MADDPLREKMKELASSPAYVLSDKYQQAAMIVIADELRRIRRELQQLSGEGRI